jgi:hypothetical protein
VQGLHLGGSVFTNLIFFRHAGLTIVDVLCSADNLCPEVNESGMLAARPNAVSRSMTVVGNSIFGDGRER